MYSKTIHNYIHDIVLSPPDSGQTYTEVDDGRMYTEFAQSLAWVCAEPDGGVEEPDIPGWAYWGKTG